MTPFGLGGKGKIVMITRLRSSLGAETNSSSAEPLSRLIPELLAAPLERASPVLCDDEGTREDDISVSNLKHALKQQTGDAAGRIHNHILT